MAFHRGRNVVWNPCRGNHLGQRSCASAPTGRTYGCKRSDQSTANRLARRGPSTSGSGQRSQPCSRADCKQLRKARHRACPGAAMSFLRSRSEEESGRADMHLPHLPVESRRAVFAAIAAMLGPTWLAKSGLTHTPFEAIRSAACLNACGLRIARHCWPTPGLGRTRCGRGLRPSAQHRCPVSTRQPAMDDQRPASGATSSATDALWFDGRSGSHVSSRKRTSCPLESVR